MISDTLLRQFLDTDMRNLLEEEWHNCFKTTSMWTPHSELTYWFNKLNGDGVEFTLLELVRLYDVEFPEIDQWLD